jgi:ABC-type transporter MlaC component
MISAPTSQPLFAAAGCLVACCLFASAAFPAGEARGGPATEAVRKSNDALRAALKKMSAAKGPGWSKARDEARSAVGSLIDFDALAESTLGKHWAELKAPERKRYVEGMRSAMEGSYLTRMEGKTSVDEVKVDYLGEEEKDGHPLVHTRFTAGQDAVAIDYVLDKSARRRAIDVITESVSLAESYREKINELWPKKGFEGVVSAFEKKARRFDADLQAKHEGEGVAPKAP